MHPTHPALCHFYTHLMEMSPTPEKALKCCELLFEQWPDFGHLVHMTSHIDIQVTYQQPPSALCYERNTPPCQAAN